ncbi:hypothetical protein [Leptothoe spongobia]|uniref:Uncharacterized protein n=1 Tax=Leptothoe spongobia TAU-MAC 1115 TaxID=1967444 RepID=A0A947DJI4_9CYAN|nr:hypothetical protein [Leptothoe spongobia]MBT9318047.1 hypothetical protein [Leptothoe spongobia TAU-MAC 1115]
MAKRLNDIEKQQIKKAWMEGDCTIPSLAKQYGVSESSIKRTIKGIPKGGGKAAIAKIATTVVNEAVESVVSQGLTSEEIEELQGVDDSYFAQVLMLVAKEALNKSRSLGFNTAGEAATTAMNALKTIRALYPLTMREAARWVVKLPGFHPEKFAQILMEEWNDNNAA